MILYHGSNIEVKVPKIIESERGRDFGFAFYLTPIKAQAERMAKRKVRVEKEGKPTISIFEWDEDTKTIKYKKYNKANIEWLEIIIKCRTDINYKHKFDIVEGKIADDSVGMTINFVLSGQLSKQQAIDKLKFQKINSQLAFCTPNSLTHIKFKKSYRL